MKNIHILPTDKPSKLIFYSTLLNEFQLLDEPIKDWERNKNIYITSDEEIKEGDWCLYGFNLESVYEGGKDWEITENSVIKCINFSALGYLIHNGGTTGKEFSKKIILTTDQDLIKDGVQAIDDEFLEWFVNNPSCEKVLVTNLYGNYNPIKCEYKIIISNEEPKQETLEYGLLQHIKMCLECNNESQAIRLLEKYGFEKQEQMYSEEEVELIANEMVNWTIDNVGNPNLHSGRKFDEVIAKFKNK